LQSPKAPVACELIWVNHEHNLWSSWRLALHEWSQATQYHSPTHKINEPVLMVLQAQTWILFAYVPESLVEKVKLALREVRRVVNQPLILMGPINGSTFNWILWFSSWHILTACWHRLRDSLPTSFGDTSSQTAPSLSPKYGSCYGKLIPRNLGTLRFDWSWFSLLGWQPLYKKCQPTYNIRHSSGQGS